MKMENAGQPVISIDHWQDGYLMTLHDAQSIDRLNIPGDGKRIGGPRFFDPSPLLSEV